MRQRKEQELESEWSLPWLVIGFAIVIDYCAYFFFLLSFDLKYKKKQPLNRLRSVSDAIAINNYEC